MENLFIEQIRPELTWRLRREVLYPDEPLYAMEMEEDNYGLHFGVFYQDQLIGVISLFQNGTDYQFRKFAVTPTLQSQGIGTAMLQYISQFVQSQGGKRLWCNARSTATNFYFKHGFQETGETFTRKGIDYKILEKNI